MACTGEDYSTSALSRKNRTGPPTGSDTVPFWPTVIVR